MKRSITPANFMVLSALELKLLPVKRWRKRRGANSRA